MEVRDRCKKPHLSAWASINHMGRSKELKRLARWTKQECASIALVGTKKKNTYVIHRRVALHYVTLHCLAGIPTCIAKIYTRKISPHPNNNNNNNNNNNSRPSVRPSVRMWHVVQSINQSIRRLMYEHRVAALVLCRDSKVCMVSKQREGKSLCSVV